MPTTEQRHLIFLAEPAREPALPLLRLAAHIGQIGRWRSTLRRSVQLHGSSRAAVHLLCLRLGLQWHAVVSGIDLPGAGDLWLLAGLIAWRVAVRWIAVSLRVAIRHSITLLVLHDRAVVAVRWVLTISIHRSLRLTRRHSVERAVLAAGIGAVGPWPSAIRAVRHAGVHCVMGLVVAVLRVWFRLSIHLRIGLHAVAVSQATWWTAAVTIIPTLVSVVSTAGLAVGRWAVAVACRTVGSRVTFVGCCILTTKMARASRSVIVVAIRLVLICSCANSSIYGMVGSCDKHTSV